MIRLVLFVLAIQIIVGCSTSSIERPHYYLLNSQKLSNELPVKNKINNGVMEVNIVFPEYLKQPLIAMSLSPHELHYAHNHKWAEPLNKSFSKSLIKDLNNHLDSKNSYVLGSGISRLDTTGLLKVDIEHFHITTQSTVILEGTFNYSENIKNQANKASLNTSSQPFTINLKLEADGFAHAVSKQRQLVKQLADKIIKQAQK